MAKLLPQRHNHAHPLLTPFTFRPLHRPPRLRRNPRPWATANRKTSPPETPRQVLPHLLLRPPRPPPRPTIPRMRHPHPSHPDEISKQFLKPLHRHVAIPQNLPQQPRTNRIPGMHWHNNHPPINMPQKMVAPFDPNHHKTRSPQRGNQLLPFHSRHLRHHYTAIRCTPIARAFLAL